MEGVPVLPYNWWYVRCLCRRTVQKTHQFNYTITSMSCSFSLFLSNDSKQDADTTTAHSKSFISLLRDKQILTTSLSKIWENTDGCAEQYRCSSALYLVSVMSQFYSIIIDRGISAPGHGKDVVDRLNTVDNLYIYIYIYIN